MIRSKTDVITNSSTEVYIIQGPENIDLKWMAELEDKINKIISTDIPDSWEGISSTEVLLDKRGLVRVTLDEHSRKPQEYLLREQKVVEIIPDSICLLNYKYNLDEKERPLSLKEEWIREEYEGG